MSTVPIWPLICKCKENTYNRLESMDVICILIPRSIHGLIPTSKIFV
ncbi:predicted protein [Botrytis cinerea T4]|uniref:Uncharacterized protein n=1 Tax=Botryotinia fuckeliana (strain T4) TaxID=999810 RepID=G2Y6Z7_BOTF4|nr:predicted protein [Botrytis cinerea T4]